MRPFFAIHPGWVTSHVDGNRHYVSAQQLVQLYGLDNDEFIVWRDHGCNYNDYVHLTPRFDGNYERPAIPLEILIPNKEERDIVEQIMEAQTNGRVGYVRRGRPKRKQD